jgi:methionyl-tRNA synthetase
LEHAYTSRDVYAVCATTLETLRVVEICLQPFVPSVAEKLLHTLGVDSEERDWGNVQVDMRKEGLGKVLCVNLF